LLRADNLEFLGNMEEDKPFFKDKYMLWMGCVFFLLALSFIFDVWGSRREALRHPLVEPRYFSREPPRQAKGEPVLMKDGRHYRCNDCHQNIEASQVQKSFFSAHPDIELNHGANNYCLTCHSLNNREALRDINGADVPYARSELSCLPCHGTIYRDWEQGVHGRMDEYWDRAKRKASQLTCVACHDPHQPDFKPMEPSPAPRAVNYRDIQNSSIEKVFHE
jgi:nitrate/TMAO reductase-like tetraheme cytochrome c subunit